MSVALVCVALAVLAVPGAATRSRLRVALAVPSRARRSVDPYKLAGVVCLPVFFVGGATAMVAVGLLWATIARRRARATRARRAHDERRKLADGLDTVIGELRVGAHPSVACDVAAEELSGDAADAFGIAAARSRLGGSGSDALRAVSSPIGPELDRVAHAWAVAEEHGLALAEILGAARADLMGRMRFRSRTESSLAGARATGVVLAGLPVLGIGLGQLMGAAPIAVLVGGGIGGILLVVGTAFVCAGLLWTDAITAGVLR